eukprot:scaffold19529_cov98-Skeletonema_marinoi.AAC.1
MANTSILVHQKLALKNELRLQYSSIADSFLEDDETNKNKLLYRGCSDMQPVTSVMSDDFMPLSLSTCHPLAIYEESSAALLLRSEGMSYQNRATWFQEL